MDIKTMTIEELVETQEKLEEGVKAISDELCTRLFKEGTMTEAEADTLHEEIRGQHDM